MRQLRCGNNGFKPIAEDYYIDENDTVQFLYTSDGMKALWQQMSEWWNAGYFIPRPLVAMNMKAG